MDVRKVSIAVLLVTVLLTGSLLIGCSSASTPTIAPATSTPETTTAPTISATTAAPATTAATTTTAAAKSIEIKLSCHFPAAHPTTDALWKPFGEQIAAKTNGRVTLKIYPASQLGKVSEEYDMTVKGTCDAALIVPTYHPGRFPLEDVFQLPFLIPGGSNNAIEKQVQDMVYEKYMIPYQFKDVKVLYSNRFEPNVLHCTKKAVRTYDDLKGLMVGFPGGSLPPQFIKAFGGSPEMVTAPDMYTSLERGMIDAELIPLETELGFKLVEISKYITVLNLGAGTNFVGIRMETWNSILPEDQKAIEELAVWAQNQTGQILEGVTNAAIGACQGAGIELINLSDADMSKLKENAKTIDAAWIADMEKQGYPAQAMYDDITAMEAQLQSK